MGALQKAPTGVTSMMDLAYVALTAALVAFSWGLVRLCDRV
jgi:hypothetical protein